MSRSSLTNLGALVALAFSLSACASAAVPVEVLPASVVAAVGGTVAQSIVADERVTGCWESLDDAKDVCQLGKWHDSLGNIKEGIAQRRLATLHAQTGDVDFRTQYAEALRSTLGEVGWLRLRRLELFDRAPAQVDEREALLRITTFQSLSTSSQALIVESAFEFRPAGGRDDAPRAVARVRYESEEIGPERDVNAVARWAQDHGRAYRRLLAEGIAENMKMTKLALQRMGGSRQQGTRKAYSLPAVAAVMEVATERGDTFNGGTLVDETADRVILAAESRGGEWLFSLPKRAVVEVACLQTP